MWRIGLIKKRGWRQCRIAKHDDHGSDHLPIETILNLQPETPHNNTKPPYNFTKTDWKALKEKIEEYLLNIDNFQSEEVIARKVNRLAKEITEVITKTIKEITFRKKISSFSKR